ncbi:unnamed protein product [Ranitomeya imitator]|uniref:Uncharacterized protein n=1 Tax=Ranitomeya imitator TaxID=111125 RepID=A0ABN9MPJ8_9NEOB|nr:unnamed protein product [Ranitomeya imitator]
MFNVQLDANTALVAQWRSPDNLCSVQISSIISFLSTGAQNWTQYSMCGLTRDLYRGSIMLSSCVSRPLLMHPMILFALAAAAWHWLLQRALLTGGMSSDCFALLPCEERSLLVLSIPIPQVSGIGRYLRYRNSDTEIRYFCDIGYRYRKCKIKN